MKPILFHSDATAELQEAADYYDRRRTGFGAAFLREVERSTSIIQNHPKIGAPYKRTSFRHFVLDRFPYVNFYLEFDTAIWIVAVAHGRRRPGHWRHRYR